MIAQRSAAYVLAWWSRSGSVARAETSATARGGTCVSPLQRNRPSRSARRASA
jgi:hypothetical protein